MRRRNAYTIIAILLVLVTFTACGKKKSETVPLSEDEIRQYDIYKLKLPEGAEGDPDFDVVAYVLADSAPTETIYEDGVYITHYTEGSVADYLYHCEEITELVIMNNFVYVSYNTTDGMEVIAGYRADGFYSIAVYNEKTDECISIASNMNVKYTHFRNGK